MSMIESRLRLLGGMLELTAKNNGNNKETKIVGENDLATMILNLLDEQVCSLVDLLDLLKRGAVRKSLGVKITGGNIKVGVGEKIFKIKDRVALEDLLTLVEAKEILKIFKAVYEIHVSEAIDKMIAQHVGSDIGV